MEEETKYERRKKLKILIEQIKRLFWKLYIYVIMQVLKSKYTCNLVKNK